MTPQDFKRIFGRSLSSTKSLTLKETGTLLKDLTAGIIPLLRELEENGAYVKIEKNWTGKPIKVIYDYDDWEYSNSHRNYRKYDVPKANFIFPSVKITVYYKREFAVDDYASKEYNLTITTTGDGEGDPIDTGYTPYDTYEKAVADVDNHSVTGFIIKFNDGVQKQSIGWNSSNTTHNIAKQVSLRYIPKMESLFKTISDNIVSKMSEYVKGCDESDWDDAFDIINAKWKRTTSKQTTITASKALEISEDIESGVKLIGKYIDQESIKSVKAVASEYNKIYGEIQAEIDKMDYDEIIALAKRLEK